MKKFASLSGLFLISMVAAQTVHADDWSRFSRIENRFYTLDSQNFQSISCAVGANVLDGLVSKLEALAIETGGKASITDTLDAYRLTFQRDKGLQIHDPKLRIEVAPKTTISDPARLKLGMAQMQAGFAGMVGGIDTQLKAFIGGLQAARRDNIHVISINNDHATYTLHYIVEGTDTTDVISGDSVTSATHRNGVNTTSEEHYQKMAGGKLLLHDANVHIAAPSASIEMEVAVQYQKLATVIFPQTITINGTTSVASSGVSSSSRLQEIIRLSDCKIVR